MRGLPDAHSEYCADLFEELEERAENVEQLFEAQEALGFDSEQVTLGSKRPAAVIEQAFGDLPRIYQWNCEHISTPFFMASHDAFANQEDAMGDPTRALLQFMIAATPNKTLAEELMADPAAHLEKMQSTWETHFVGGHSVISALVSNVPDTVSPVKAKAAFIQVPNGDSMALELVWKVRSLSGRGVIWRGH